MNLDCWIGVCRQFLGGLKERCGVVCGNSRIAAAGRRERLLGRVQEQRGIAKAKADRQLAEFRSRHRRWWDLSQG